MKHRKLRIAWSVASGVAAVAMIALWVRSYWYQEIIGYKRSTNDFVVTSAGGSIYINIFQNTDLYWWSRNAGLVRINQTFFSTSPTHWFTWFRWDATEIKIPTWCPTGIFAVIATIPWIASCNRFSLRTLLIATTLVAVGLGLTVWLK